MPWSTHVIGLDPPSLIPLACTIDVSDAPARFTAVAADWIEDRYGLDRFVWQDHWHHAPHGLLAQAFTRAELIRLWYDCIFSSKLDDHFQEHEPLVWKVQHALWRYSCGCSRDYPRFVDCHNGLGRLTVDLPGFDVRITHTRSINTAAWAAHGRDKPIYLDASFGTLVYYRGRHVMTIGFAPSECGVLIAQVQLREKHGNRFLYKLPMSYLDFALDLIQRAFPRDALYLVTGASTTRAIRAAYGRDAAGPPADTMRRVARFYDQTLANYARTGETVSGSSDDGRSFVRLENSNTRYKRAA
jgi:hypothetical protein